ncbi:MAG: PAS domain S-box protein [Thermomicrobiales bacterium]|nr:PAS domain S-box protein [Thermomicrobiales bacterium]
MQQTPDAQLAAILDHVGDGVTAQDPSGHLIYANAAAARSLGFASAAELLATPLAEVGSRFSIFDENEHIIAPEDLPGRRALTRQSEQSALIRFLVHATGEERWAIVRSSPVTDEAGNVRFVVNVWQDATRQRRAECAQRFLAEAGEVLATSLDVEATLASIASLAVPRLADWCAVHLVRDDGTVEQVAVAHVDPDRIDRALQLQERYPVDPEADQGVHQVIRTGQPELIPEITEEMLVAGAIDAEHLDILRRVGLTSILVVPMIARGKTLGAISFVTAESGHTLDEHDLDLAQELARRAALAVENARLYHREQTTRRLAEDARARFRMLFESVPNGILVVDADGRYIEANPAVCELLGYQQDELLERQIEDIAAEPEEARRQMAQLIASGEVRITSQMRRKNGTLVPVELWARRLDLPSGAVSLAVVRDITDRVAADQIREEVLTAIAHDLRSPLSSIKLHAQMLLRALRRDGEVDPQRLEDGLAAVDTLSSRVAFLLEDIVDIARSRDDPAMAFMPVETDLVALAERCREEIRLASSRDIRLVTDQERIIGSWDTRGIERVVLNLLTNAVKYSPVGSDITLSLDVEGDALLAVQDRGIGIPAGDLPLIFERYRRGRNVGETSGTGLGLTGARQIVERHGGSLDIASVEGQGTTVTIRLPLQPEPGET